jgi:hypothetical protein
MQDSRSASAQNGAGGAELPDDVVNVCVQLLSGEESGDSDALWSAAMAVVESSEEQGKFLRNLLRDALWSTEPYFQNDTLGARNIADGLFGIAGGLHAIAEAIRGDARPVVRHVHERAPRPEPEGDTGPQVTKVDKRRAS